MVCRSIPLPTGGHAIVCGPRERKKRCSCGRPASLLCDWKVPTKRNPKKTCDAPICDRCTTSPAEDKDLCPAHAVAFRAWREARAHLNEGKLK